MDRKYVSFTLIALVLAATPVIGYQVVRQAGGDDFPEVVLRSVSGPYRVMIGTIPDRARTGTLHLAIDLMTAQKSAPSRSIYTRLLSTNDGPAEQRQPVTDAAITVAGLGPGGERLTPVHALNGSVDRQYYDAALAVPAPGKWLFGVTITSTLGKGVVEVPVRIHEAAVPWGLILRWTIPLLLLLAAVLYTVARNRRRIFANR
ncbi:MAG: hypothetical protein KGJ12_01855 [Gammaproteobacteria bacterium]|nr:hypothetical protein [Gammaproteobacteria bacterium]